LNHEIAAWIGFFEAKRTPRTLEVSISDLIAGSNPPDGNLLIAVAAQGFGYALGYVSAAPLCESFS
jgi:hypothetical protein